MARRERVCAISAFAWIALLGIAALVGAAVGAEPAAQPQSVPDTAELDRRIEAVNARMAEIQTAADLTDAVRQELLAAQQQHLDLLKETQGYLTQVQAHAAKSLEFKQAREEAPATLLAIQTELKATQAEPQPQVPPDATLAQLEQLSTQAQADLEADRKKAAELEAELKRRADRREEVARRTAEAKQALTQIEEELAVPVAEGNGLAETKRLRLLAKKAAFEAELEALKEELLSYDARRDLLAARRDAAARKVAVSQKLAAVWQELVNERRRLEADREAAQARREAARAHPAVRELAEANTRLAEERTGSTSPAARIARLSPNPEDVRDLTAELQRELQNVKERVQAAGGFTKAIGIQLLRRREDLPELRRHRQLIRRLETEESEVQLKLIDILQERFADVEQSVQSILAGLDAGVTESQRQDIETQARELLQARRDYLDALETDYNAYASRLSALIGSEWELVQLVQGYAEFIDEHVLWVRSTSPIGLGTFAEARDAALWLGSPRGWAGVARQYWQRVRGRPARALVVLLAVVAVLLSGRWLRAALKRTAVQVQRPDRAKFSDTLLALAATALMAMRWPLLLLLGAWQLAEGQATSQLAEAVAPGMRRTAVAFLVLAFLRTMCGRAGLADAHFRVRREARNTLRRHLLWFMPIFLPMVFVVGVLGAQSEDVRADSLGRFVFIAGMLTLSVFLLILLRPGGALVRSLLLRNRGGWLDRLRHVWYGLVVALPAALAVLSVLGYQYTASALDDQLGASLILVLAVVLMNALTVRWLMVTRRRIAVRTAQDSRAAADGEAGGDVAAAGSVQTDESIYVLSRQTQQLVRAFLVTVVVIGLYWIWAGVLPALGKLDEVVLWRTTAPAPLTLTEAGAEEALQSSQTIVPITLADLALALLLLLITFVAGRNLPALLEIAVLRHLPMDRGVRFAITTLARYVIVVVGVVVSFTTLGIGWSKVQWLVAAMTVGLGFGLQEIFANFVSGLIILFERPMRVGDTVTVGDTTGTVSRIRIRATTILDWNRKELVVPNKEFITGRLVNWTLSDTVLRMVFPVGIAYGSDTVLAEKRLLQVAADAPSVLADPKPVVVFKGFGESSLDFELRLFIPNLESYVPVWHQVNRGIDDAFREAGIEIAFPQRDLHVRSVSTILPLDVRQAEQPEPPQA